MKCIIVEDQPPAQRILKKYIADYGMIELVGTFADALQAIEFLKSNTVDLIFLDIHLPKLSGIDFLKTIQNPPSIIMTTAFPDFALESYDFDVVDYLLKPFSFPRFVKAVSKVSDARNTSNTEHNDSLFIKSGHEYIKVLISDIEFIKSDSDYTEITYNGTRLLSSESLKFWEKELVSHDFLRVHKSYLININKIKKVTSSTVLISDHNEIPIGRAFKEAFSERVLK
ncbi:LytR/AlgR family response regulator transcription factor [Portibacter lacus]|uniref:DNA-binding response regulator n=1 Tax=Portibacter lacus TaxID=1099794 RepID=A0AA37WCY0_9BACT|nr:LytTR family DNA-binding domain-containing protein [Portibacter lacus]GLR17216.1 DNA-binding response regulator [Portibacter lacus]